MSFAQGSSRLSRFFSVHIQPPNDRVRRLLESGIGELLQKLSSQQHPNQGREHAKGRQTGDGGVEAAGDKVVEYIAAILIKVSVKLMFCCSPRFSWEDEQPYTQCTF